MSSCSSVDTPVHNAASFVGGSVPPTTITIVVHMFVASTSNPRGFQSSMFDATTGDASSENAKTDNNSYQMCGSEWHRYFLVLRLLSVCRSTGLSTYLGIRN